MSSLPPEASLLCQTMPVLSVIPVLTNVLNKNVEHVNRNEKKYEKKLNAAALATYISPR